MEETYDIPNQIVVNFVDADGDDFPVLVHNKETRTSAIASARVEADHCITVGAWRPNGNLTINNVEKR